MLHTLAATNSDNTETEEIGVENSQSYAVLDVTNLQQSLPILTNENSVPVLTFVGKVILNSRYKIKYFKDYDKFVVTF